MWFIKPNRQEHSLSSELLGKVTSIAYEECAERCANLSFFFAIAFIIYGFTSYEFLNSLRPFDFFDNIWPRVLFNGLPFLLLGFFARKKTIKPTTRMIIWIFGFALNLHFAAWIQFWPIVLTGHPVGIGVAHAANLYSTTLAFVIIAPPASLLPFFHFALISIFWVPFMLVSNASASSALTKTIGGDILHTSLLNSFLSLMIFQVRKTIITLNLEKQNQAEKFLGKTVSAAIYLDRKDLLKERATKAYIVSIDIRGYTKLVLDNHHTTVAGIMADYHKLVATNAEEFEGYIHKSAGDGYLVSFGLVDSIDLDDLAEVDPDVLAANKAEKNRKFTLALDFLNNVSKQTMELFKRSNILMNLSLGAAIDYGDIELKIIGDQSSVQNLIYLARL